VEKPQKKKNPSCKLVSSPRKENSQSLCYDSKSVISCISHINMQWIPNHVKEWHIYCNKNTNQESHKLTSVW